MTSSPGRFASAVTKPSDAPDAEPAPRRTSRLADAQTAASAPKRPTKPPMKSRAKRKKWPQLQTPIEPEVHEQLRLLAEERERSMSDLVRTAVKQWVAIEASRGT